MNAKADCPETLTPSNSSPTLTAAEHLELASTLLERQAAEALSGTQARTLQALAEIFNVLALKLDDIARTQGRAA